MTSKPVTCCEVKLAKKIRECVKKKKEKRKFRIDKDNEEVRREGCRPVELSL